MKYCEDCKFSQPDSDGDRDPEFMRCRAPQNEKVQGITRVPTEYRWIYCSTQRDGGLIVALMTKSCGRGARWFQPKGQPA